MDSAQKRDKIRQESKELRANYKILQQKYEAEKETNQSLSEQNEALCAQCQTLRDERDTYKSRVSELHTQNLTLTDDVEQLRKENSTLHNTVKCSEQKVSEVDKLELNLDSYKRKCISLESENRSLESETHRIRRQLAECKESLEISEARVGQNSEKLNDLKQQVQDEVRRSRDADKVKRNLEQLQSIHAKCAGTFAKLSKEVEDQKLISAHARKALLQEKEQRKKSNQQLDEAAKLEEELELCRCEVDTLKGLLVGKDALLVQKSQAVSLSKEVLTHLDTSGQSLELIQYLETINNPQYVQPQRNTVLTTQSPRSSVLTNQSNGSLSPQSSSIGQYPSPSVTSSIVPHNFQSSSTSLAQDTTSGLHRKQQRPIPAKRQHHMKRQSLNRTTPPAPSVLESTMESTRTPSYDSVYLPPTRNYPKANVTSAAITSTAASHEAERRSRADCRSALRHHRAHRSLSPTLSTPSSSCVGAGSAGTTHSPCSPASSYVTSRSHRSMSPSHRHRTSSPAEHHHTHRRQQSQSHQNITELATRGHRTAVVRPRVYQSTLPSPYATSHATQHTPPSQTATRPLSAHRRSSSSGSSVPASFASSNSANNYNTSTLPSFPYVGKSGSDESRTSSREATRDVDHMTAATNEHHQLNHVVKSIVNIGDRVIVDLSSTGTSSDYQYGCVKYIDCIGDSTELTLGISLDNKVGDTNGSYRGRRYFRTANKHGMFVQIEQIISVYNKQNSSYEQFETLLKDAIKKSR